MAHGRASWPCALVHPPDSDVLDRASQQAGPPRIRCSPPPAHSRWAVLRYNTQLDQRRNATHTLHLPARTLSAFHTNLHCPSVPSCPTRHQPPTTRGVLLVRPHLPACLPACLPVATGCCTLLWSLHYNAARRENKEAGRSLLAGASQSELNLGRGRRVSRCATDIQTIMEYLVV